MHKYYIFPLIALSCIGFTGESLAQEMSQKEFRKLQRALDLSHSGIGIDLSQPKLGSNVFAEKPWRGVSIAMEPIIGGYGHIQISHFT